MLHIRPEICKLWPVGQIWPAPAFLSKVLLEHSHPHSFAYYIQLLLCYNGKVEQSWQIVFLPKPKMFTFKPFTGKVCRPLHRTSSLVYSLRVLVLVSLKDTKEQEERQQARRNGNAQKIYWNNDNSTIPKQYLLNAFLGVEIENSMEAARKRNRIFLVIRKSQFFFPLPCLHGIWASCFPPLIQPLFLLPRG